MKNKKFKILIILMLILSLSLTSCLFAACDKGEENVSETPSEEPEEETPPPTVTSISLIEDTWYYDYQLNEEIYLDGTKIKVKYSDNTTKKISVKSSMVKDFDTSAVGTYECRIVYQKKSCTVEYTVYGIDTSGIYITKITTDDVIQDSYYVDEPATLIGVNLTVYYSDDTTEDVVVTEEMYTKKFDTTIATTSGVAEATFTTTKEDKTINGKFSFNYSVVAPIDATYLSYSTTGSGVTINGINTGIEGKVVLPNYIEDLPVTRIADNAFNGNTKITDLVIQSNVSDIGEGAFKNSSIANFVIPNTIKNIGKQAFTGSAYLSQLSGDYLIINDILVAYKGASENVVIPDGVLSINAYTFENNLVIKTVNLGKDVKSIGYRAFYGATKLDTVTGATSNLNEIGKEAFQYCSSLKIIDLAASSVKLIDDNTFYDCVALSSFGMPSGLTAIGNQAFRRCKSLTSIGTLPTSLLTIGAGAFDACAKLTIDLSESKLTDIGAHAFIDCSSLSEITLPRTLVSLGEEVFMNCYNMRKVTLPSNITSLPSKAFAGCTALAIVYVGSGIVFTKQADTFNMSYPVILVDYALKASFKQAWTDCADRIVTNSNLINNDYIKDGEKLIKYIGNNTTLTLNEIEIADYALYGNMTVENITLNNATAIGANAFKNCISLKTIDVGNSVTSIGSNAFYGCSKLASFTISAPTPPSLGDNAFYFPSNIDFRIKLASELISEYEVADGWNNYNNRIVAID